MHAMLRSSLLLCVIASAPLLGQTGDSSSSAGLDIGSQLMRKGGFVLVPLVVSRPAYAAGVGLYRPLDSGRVRYMGAAGGSSIDLKFYGTNPNGYIASNPLHYNFSMVGLLQRLQMRLTKAPLYAGLQYTYASTRSDFAPYITPSGVPTDLRINLAGLGTSLEYDSRDNAIDPRQGISLNANATGYSNALGGSSNFGKAGAGRSTSRSRGTGGGSAPGSTRRAHGATSHSSSCPISRCADSRRSSSAATPSRWARPSCGTSSRHA